jgi:hypothetical protein
MCEKPSIPTERTKMRTKNALLAIAAVCAVAYAGRSEAGPGAQTDLGTIIVYRPWSLVWAAAEFNLNHGPDLMIRNGTYYRLTVLPGNSTISHDNMPLPIDEDEQTVHVDPGQTVYFQYIIGLSLIFEEADNQEKAASTVSRLQPLN